jgi:predicted enzyme related to lactoylglutathione lyase
MPRVIHFELQADDPDRATKFYEDVFGWKTARLGDGGAQSYWIMTTGDGAEPGINGGIMRRDTRFPGNVNTLDVPDVDAYCEKVTAGGGKVTMPRFAVQGMGWAAYCEDTEGNMFGIFKPDPAAK